MKKSFRVLLVWVFPALSCWSQSDMLVVPQSSLRCPLLVQEASSEVSQPSVSSA